MLAKYPLDYLSIPHRAKQMDSAKINAHFVCCTKVRTGKENTQKPKIKQKPNKADKNNTNLNCQSVIANKSTNFGIYLHLYY